MSKAMLERSRLPDDHPPATSGVMYEEVFGQTDILGFLKRYRTVLACCTLTGAVAALAYIAVVPPTFRARAQLLLDPGMVQQLSHTAGEINVSIDTPQIESQMAVLRSERIVSAVFEKLDLMRDPEIAGGEPGWLSRLTSGNEPSAYEKMRAAIVRFQAALEVRRLGLSHAIDIAFTSRDPDKAARVANAVADAYIGDQIASRADAARQGSEWLEMRLDRLRGQMNRASLAVQEFKARRDYRIAARRDAADGDQKAGGQDAAGARVEQITLEELEARARTYSAIYESYLQAYLQSVQRETFSVSSARVITSASRPLRKSNPNSVVVLATGTLLGLLCGIAIAFVRHAMQPAASSGGSADRPC